jgi:hypothetical protein
MFGWRKKKTNAKNPPPNLLSGPPEYIEQALKYLEEHGFSFFIS